MRVFFCPTKSQFVHTYFFSFPTLRSILLVIIINVIVGLIQEGKAEKAASAINNMLAPTATVTRDGENKIIDSVKLVVGDIVSLKAGDRVPADLRVIFSSNLKVWLFASGDSDGTRRIPA